MIGLEKLRDSLFMENLWMFLIFMTIVPIFILT
jgi:hypothetical protein